MYKVVDSAVSSRLPARAPNYWCRGFRWGVPTSSWALFLMEKFLFPLGYVPRGIRGIRGMFLRDVSSGVSGVCSFGMFPSGVSGVCPSGVSGVSGLSGEFPPGFSEKERYMGENYAEPEARDPPRNPRTSGMGAWPEGGSPGRRNCELLRSRGWYTVKITIDGNSIDVNPGTTIFSAAKQLGLDIPIFCYQKIVRPPSEPAASALSKSKKWANCKPPAASRPPKAWSFTLKAKWQKMAGMAFWNSS